MGHRREDYFCHEEDLKTRHRRHAGGPVKDARGAVDFYARAFGASEQSSRRPLAELASG
jgi:hypothetical protein